MLLSKIESCGMGMENPALESMAATPVPSLRSCVSYVGVDQPDAQCQGPGGPSDCPCLSLIPCSPSSLLDIYPESSPEPGSRLTFFLFPQHPSSRPSPSLVFLSLHKRVRNSILEGSAQRMC